jgi:uncharacterized membrane protein YccC
MSVQASGQSLTNKPALPPPPRAPQPSLLALFSLRPGPNRWFAALRAACAMGLAGLAGWAFYDLAAGLIATMGAFTALYGSDRPYRNRAALLGAVVAGFVVCVTTGVLAATWLTPWPGILVAAAGATVAAFLCSAARTGPPGAYLFALATAASTSMHSVAPSQVALSVALGGIIGFALQTVGALWRPHGPEEQAVARAAEAVADFVDHAQNDSHDILRHATASSLYESWTALVGRQPSSTLADGKLHRLRALNRELHRLFGNAIVTANLGATPDPAASAKAREIARVVRDPPAVGSGDKLNEPLSYIGGLSALKASLQWGATPLRIAMRVGIAALIAGFFGALIGLDRSYWAIAAAVLMLYQGFDWSRTFQRGLERVAGTLVGLLLAWLLLGLGPGGLTLIVMLTGLQFIIEMVVVRNYALAAVFITPAALLIATGARPVDDLPLLLQTRGLDTLIGCAIGLIVLFFSSSVSTSRLRENLSKTLIAAARVVPFLAHGEVTDEAARSARRTLRNSALSLQQLYDEQAAGLRQGRDGAVSFWPATVIVQRIAFEILATCWEMEAAGAAATPSLSANQSDSLVQALYALAEGKEPNLTTVPAFLRAELAMATESLRAAKESSAR